MENVHTGVTGPLGHSVKGHAALRFAELAPEYVLMAYRVMKVVLERDPKLTAAMFQNVLSGKTGPAGHLALLHVVVVLEVIQEHAETAMLGIMDVKDLNLSRAVAVMIHVHFIHNG